jgi:hypothetical protein
VNLIEGDAGFCSGFCPGFSECRVFSAGMKIVVDKNLENTVWQVF